MIGVAISTTGHEHRMKFLETCVAHWQAVLPQGSVLIVTVDGTEEDALRVRDRLWKNEAVYRVGQFITYGPTPVPERMGVAVNKNTGLELLMDAMVTQAFLCDDDTWPLNEDAITLHTRMGQPHSMVCWGAHRWHPGIGWTWPRGCVLYVEPQVLAQVGGMIEGFGIGGHEHVEWSRRIHQAGITGALYPAPAVYAARGGMGACVYWHAEDMKMAGVPLGNHRLHRRQITTIHHEPGDWERASLIMDQRDGDTSYVPFRAAENGRASATIPTRGAQAPA